MNACFAAPITSGAFTARPLVQQAAVTHCHAPVVSMSFRMPRFGRAFKLPPFGSGAGFGLGGIGQGSGSGINFGGAGGRFGKGRNSGGGAADDKGGNVFTALWTGYNLSLEKNPILTKALTSLIGFFLGDLLAQKFLSADDAEINKGRLARMASFGFLIHGPTGHYFYSALDRVIVGTSPLKVASKVAIDQVLWAPIFTCLFFGYLGIAERKSRKEIVDKIKNDTWTGVKASWKFWPVAHTINFALIPTSQRLLYINTLQVGYNVILSLIGNK